MTTIDLNERDIQWLSALMATATTLLNHSAPDDTVEHNLVALETLYYELYSHTEATALQRRVAALLPLDSALHLVYLNNPMPPSTSSLVS